MPNAVTLWIMGVVVLIGPGCSTPSSAPSRFDAAAARAKSAEERQARGMAPLCRFVGEFTDGGLPKERVRAIPLDGHDFQSFALTAKVLRLVEGALPAGLESEVVFAVHSPARFFLRQGIRLTRGTHYPEGRYLLTLWVSPDGSSQDLEVVPAEARSER